MEGKKTCIFRVSKSEKARGSTIEVAGGGSHYREAICLTLVVSGQNKEGICT